HGMVGTLDVVAALLGPEREAERLAVAFEADHLPAAPAMVAAVLRRREAALERVLDDEIHEGAVPAPRIGREARVEHLEQRVLRGRIELRERRAGLAARDLVDAREALAIDVA